MKNVYTCIDIGSDTIRILVSELYDGKLHTLAVSSVKSKGIKYGLIVDQAVLSERINLALDDIEDRINILKKHQLKENFSGLKLKSKKVRFYI